VTKSDGQGREERKAVQRARILEAAREIFFRDGFMAANLDEVALSAGVAKGTLYRYFESKGDLYVALLAENGRAFEERMREVAFATGSASDRIRKLGRFYFGHWTRNPTYFQIFWALENPAVTGDLPKQAVAAVVRLWEDCLRILADVIRSGVDSGEFGPRAARGEGARAGLPRHGRAVPARARRPSPLTAPRPVRHSGQGS
jgi:AcrR family transcriptional regulator